MFFNNNVLAIWTLLLAVIHVFHAYSVEPQKRTSDIDWPEVFGEDNLPTNEHLLAWVEHFGDRPEGDVAELSHVEAGFWNTLLAIRKCSAEGEWIKSMFENVNQGAGEADVVVYKRTGNNGGFQGYTVGVSSTDLPEESISRPLWPLFLGKAALDAHWDTGTAGPKELLELLTGYNAVYIEKPSMDQWKDALAVVDTTPVLIQHHTPRYSVQFVWDAVVTVSKDPGESIVLGRVDTMGHDDNDPVDKLGLDAERYHTNGPPEAIVYLQDERVKAFVGRPEGELKPGPPPA